MLAVTLPQEYESALYERFLDINKRAMEQAKKEMFNPSERYITQNELLKKFKIGNKQLEEWRVKGLKYVRIGRTVRYDLHDVYEIIEQDKK